MELQNINSLLSFRVRIFLYLSSLSTLLFTRTYCVNVCPFIDGRITAVADVFDALGSERCLKKRGKMRGFSPF